MFSQPRINDIASLYQGNPGALQQRIQQAFVRLSMLPLFSVH